MGVELLSVNPDMIKQIAKWIHLTFCFYGLALIESSIFSSSYRRYSVFWEHQTAPKSKNPSLFILQKAVYFVSLQVGGTSFFIWSLFICNSI